MTPFERFFAEEWPRLLASVPDRRDLFSNGASLRAASWDRQAAYLVFEAQATPKIQPPPVYDL